MALHDLLVRLGLQAKEFQDGIKNVTADLKQVEKNTQSTTTVMKAAWRDLGIKSTEYIEAKKASVTKAYETIRASGVYSAQEVLRAEQAKNVKLKALDEQQFGNQTSLLTSMKTHWMAYSASAYAALAVISKGWALAEASAGYIEQMQLLDGLARKYGTSATIIVQKIKEVGEGMISMSTAAEIGLSGLAKGLNPEMLYGLSKAAVVLSDVMGVTANEAFQRMAEALEMNKMKALKLAVGTIDLKDKYGDLADKMTEAEKQAALYNIIMEKTAEIQGQTMNSTKSVSDKMETFRVAIADLKIEMGIYLIKAGAGVIGTFKGIYSAGLLVTSGIWKLIEAKERLKALFTWGDWKASILAEADIAASMASENWKMSGKAATDAQQNLKLVITSTKGLIEAEKSRGSVVNSVTDSVRKREDAEKAAAKAAKEAEQAYSKMYGNLKFEAKGYVEYAKKKLEEERDQFIKVTGDKTLANQWYWAELNKLYQEQLYGMTQLEKEQAQESIKVAKDKLAELNDNWKKYFDPAEWKKVNDTIGAIFIESFGGITKSTKEQKQAVADMTAAYNQMYGDLKGKATTYYDFLKGNLEKQAADYAKMTGDKVMAAAWLAEKLKQLDIEEGKSSESLFAGIKAGYLELTNTLYTWGQAGYDMFKTFTGSMSSTFKTLGTDVISGHLKSFGDYFKSVWDSMLAKFIDILAQMLAEWLTLQAAMKASQWLGFGSYGAQQSGGNKALGMGQQVGMNMGSSALYNYLFGGGVGAGAGGGIMATAGGGSLPAVLSETGAIGAGTSTGASTGMAAAAGTVAIWAAVALATEQVLEHGEEWLYAAMGGKEETRGRKDIRRMLMDPNDYRTTPWTAEEIGAPVYDLNPAELAQYREDKLREWNMGVEYIKSLKESSLYAQMAANPPPGYSGWEEYGRYMRDLPAMHSGGIIKAHGGLYLAPDERLIVGQTGERVLNREQTKDYDKGRDNGQPIVVNVYLDSEKIQRSIYQATKYGEPIIYEGGITNR